MKQALIICLALCLSGCATILGGRKTDKPTDNAPKRRVRWGFVIADLITFPPGLIIDFATGMIYKEGKKLPTKPQ